MTEQNTMLTAFQGAYSSTKETPRAIYGVGINTKFILDQINGYNIVALMDKNTVGDVLYQLPVKSPEEIVGTVEEIVIVAHFMSLNIIYQRIQHLEERGISIKCVDGTPLSLLFSVTNQDYSDFSYPNQDELAKKVESASVISFDMFDTLVQRRVLEPEDIFRLVQEKSGFPNFFSQRLAAQKESTELSGAGQNFQEIYDLFEKNTGCDVKTRKELVELEIELEFSHIIPRHSGVTLFNQCKEEGKILYILSDMYFPKEILEKILKSNGIEGYEACIVSSDYGKSKGEGSLYSILKEQAKSDSILHIGDNKKADVEKAIENGIVAYHFMSYSQLLTNSPFSVVLNQAISLMDSLLLGTIFSNLFDSPFSLSQYQGRFHLKTTEQVGTLSIVPMLLKFISWELNQVKTVKHARIFYMARDGFLPYQIHKRLIETGKYPNLPSCEYVYASRRGLIMPSLETEADILDFLQLDRLKDLNLAGSVMEERFGLQLDLGEDFSHLSANEKKSNVLRVIHQNKETILEKSAQERREYLDYLSQFQVNQTDSIYLFDLVTRGTFQKSFNKITKGTAKMLCFASRDLEEEDESTLALFGNSQCFAPQNYFIFTSFIALEQIFSSQEGQFLWMEQGKPRFRPEPPKPKELVSLQGYLEKETLQWLTSYTLCQLETCSLGLVDSLHRCLQKEYSVISSQLKDYFVIDDTFNQEMIRLFDLTEMEFDG